MKGKLQISRDNGIYFDEGSANETHLIIREIQDSRYLADRDWLVVGSSSGIWIVDLQKRSLVWNYSVPSRMYSMAYDPKRQELLSTHEDGVVRRWKLPEKR